MRTLLPTLAILAASACQPADDPRNPRIHVADDAPEPTEVVARWKDGDVTMADVEERIGGELRELEIRYLLAQHERRLRTIDQLVDAALLETEATRRGLDSIDALLELEVERRTPEPTEQQIRALYPAISEQVGGVSLDLARPLVRERLVRHAREQRYREFIGELRTAAGLEIELDWPDLPRIDVPVAAHDPARGPADAPVTVVQFAEYTCTWCVESGDALRRVHETWPDEVRVVFKDFPLAGNPRALPASIAAQCAAEQGRFWEMHERLLEDQTAFATEDLVEHAVALSLDRDRFEDCLLSSRPLDGIYEDLALGRSVGVRGTPTWFVNGIVVPGVQPWAAFAAIVEREIERTASR